MDFPPANAIRPNDFGDYPIIRCEDCHEIPMMDLNMDKREIRLKCEKEGKTKDIPFENFFQTIKKYEDMNCCEFCRNKNPSQKYYLCKTCSNKILCEKCFNEHNKNDDIIKFEMDSTCKKHYHQFESYCPACKENKCSYCSVDHEESHEKNEIPLKKKLIKKNKIDELKETIKKMKKDKDEIAQKMNLVIKELEEKLQFINNLKNKFFEYLRMKIQFVELLLNNYEKKLENYNINYFFADNLERHININLLELNINKNDTLDKKIQNISDYINENLDSKFSKDNEKRNFEIEKQKNIWDNDVTDVDFNNLKNFEFDNNIIGFLDFNKDLFIIYSSLEIYFISKYDYKIKFQLKEYGIDEIQICKKINDLKLLMSTNKDIIFVDIINNSDYKIDKKIALINNIYDFNSNLDLLYRNLGSHTIDVKLLLFPDFNRVKLIINHSLNYNKYSNEKLKFINDNIFFHVLYKYLSIYEINNNKGSLIKSLNIDIDSKNVSIIELNREFYCLNDKRKILLLNKKNLDIAKTISLVSNNLGFLKISENLISIFVFDNDSYKLFSNNYTISLNGIKWNLSQTKNLSNKKFYSCCNDNNYILFINDKGCSLFDIKAKKYTSVIDFFKIF